MPERGSVLINRDDTDRMLTQIDTPAVNLDSAAIRVLPATEQDTPLILSFIQDLAEYERLAAACVATEDRVRRSHFGEKPDAEVLLAISGEEPVGFVLYFHNYSTLLATRGDYLQHH